MKKILLVIDMQEICVGRNHNPYFTYDGNKLIEKVNKVIAEYDKDAVIYIQNVMKKGIVDKFAPFKAYENTPETNLAEGLLVINDMIIKKWKGDAFTNPELDLLLKEKGAAQIECVGVDGAGCVAMTARGAKRAGYEVSVRLEATATVNEAARKKQNNKLEKMGICII